MYTSILVIGKLVGFFFSRFFLILIPEMSRSPNSIDSWPSDKGSVEPSILAEDQASSEAVQQALIVPLEFEGPDPEEFPLGWIRSKLSKETLTNFHHKYHVPLEFILEVPLSTDRICNLPKVGSHCMKSA